MLIKHLLKNINIVAAFQLPLATLHSVLELSVVTPLDGYSLFTPVSTLSVEQPSMAQPVSSCIAIHVIFPNKLAISLHIII